MKMICGRSTDVAAAAVPAGASRGHGARQRAMSRSVAARAPGLTIGST